MTYRKCFLEGGRKLNYDIFQNGKINFQNIKNDFPRNVFPEYFLYSKKTFSEIVLNFEKIFTFAKRFPKKKKKKKHAKRTNTLQNYTVTTQ